MNNVLKINFGKRKRLTSVLGLTLDGSRLEGVVLRRTNGSLQLRQTFSVALSLDPLTAAPELVGREIRNHLDAAGVRERHCVVGVPLKWALTAHTELPPLPEADAASLLQLEAERGFPCDVATLRLANSRCPLAGRQTTRDAGGYSQCPTGGAGTGFGGGEIKTGQLFARPDGLATTRRGKRPVACWHWLSVRARWDCKSPAAVWRLCARWKALSKTRPDGAGCMPISWRARRALRWDNCRRNCATP